MEEETRIVSEDSLVRSFSTGQVSASGHASEVRFEFPMQNGSRQMEIGKSWCFVLARPE